MRYTLILFGGRSRGTRCINGTAAELRRRCTRASGRAGLRLLRPLPLESQGSLLSRAGAARWLRLCGGPPAGRLPPGCCSAVLWPGSRAPGAAAPRQAPCRTAARGREVAQRVGMQPAGPCQSGLLAQAVEDLHQMPGPEWPSKPVHKEEMPRGRGRMRRQPGPQRPRGGRLHERRAGGLTAGPRLQRTIGRTSGTSGRLGAGVRGSAPAPAGGRRSRARLPGSPRKAACVATTRTSRGSSPCPPPLACRTGTPRRPAQGGERRLFRRFQRG